MRGLKHITFSLVAAALTLVPAGAHSFELTIPLHDAKVIPLGAPAQKISVSEASVADVKPLSPRALVINAKGLGETRVTIIDQQGGIGHHKVSVVMPTKALARRIKQILPDQQIKVTAVGATVALSGTVDSAVAAERAASIAAAHLRNTKAKVLNYLTVKGQQQVQLRVKIAEVSRSALRQVGINAWHRTGSRAAGMLAPGTSLANGVGPDLGTVGNGLQPGGSGSALGSDGSGPLPMLATPFTSGAFGLLFSTQDSSSFPLSIALNLLQGKGLVKVISEPTLVSFSGQEATFLSGGEFPVPVPQGLGQMGVEFKKHGVQLAFTPTVLNSNRLRIKVNVTVSAEGEKVMIGNTPVSKLETRNSTTTVQLGNGQSFAIAGLLQEKVQSKTEKVPLLGDIPVLGMLFRKKFFERAESELVILITAHLVHPLDPRDVPPLPGENEQSDPGSLRFFLMATDDARTPVKPRGPAGPVGFNP